MSTGYLQVGDLVVVNEYGVRFRSDGFDSKILVVTGFRHRVVGRLDGYRCAKPAAGPGIYLDPSYVGVATNTGISRQGHYRHEKLRLLDEELARERAPRPSTPPLELLCDLPDTAFWEGDIVAKKDSSEGEPQQWVVTAVDHFACMTDHGDVPNRIGVYQLSTHLKRGSVSEDSRLVPASQLELIARGNIWRHYHNQELEFTPETELYDRVLFAIFMGWFEPVGPPDISRRRLFRRLSEEPAHGWFMTGAENSLQPFLLNDEALGKAYAEAIANGEHPVRVF